MKKKNHVFCGFCVFSLIMLSLISEGSLTVIPSIPTTNDSVSIELSTWLANPGVVVTGANQTVNGYDIYLDVFTYQLPGVWAQIVVDFDHTFPIGTLPAGIYQVYAGQGPSAGNVNYYESCSFEVVPEPTTLGLLAMGSIALVRKRRCT